MKAERGEETTKEKFEASRVWFMRFRGLSYIHNSKMQDEAASAHVEAAENHQEDLGMMMKMTILNKGFTFLKNYLFIYLKEREHTRERVHEHGRGAEEEREASSLLKIVKKTKDLDYYIIFFERAVTGFKNFERSPTIGKMLSNITSEGKIIHKRKRQKLWETFFFNSSIVNPQFY